MRAGQSQQSRAHGHEGMKNIDARRIYLCFSFARFRAGLTEPKPF